MTPADLARLTREQREDWEERAAILEFLALRPRPEAERLAYEMVTGRNAQQELFT